MNSVTDILLGALLGALVGSLFGLLCARILILFWEDEIFAGMDRLVSMVRRACGLKP